VKPCGLQIIPAPYRWIGNTCADGQQRLLAIAGSPPGDRGREYALFSQISAAPATVAEAARQPSV